MIHRETRTLLLGLSTLTGISVVLIVLAKILQPTIPEATMWVLIWAGIESLLAFRGLNWGLERSDRAFLSVFFGGTLLRLFSLGLIASFLVALQIPPAIPLISLVSAYFVLSMAQIPFICIQANGRAG
jgi:hypothetical protein